jgi:hypothetical protein
LEDPQERHPDTANVPPHCPQKTFPSGLEAAQLGQTDTS